jgi:hypothetical protein
MQSMPRESADPVSRRQRRTRAEAVNYLLSTRGQRFANACWDCPATAAISVGDGGQMNMHVWHAETCPAVAGLVPFRCGAEGRRR